MKKGFTLIELLAVVLIMGILTAVALPQYRKSVERARVAEALQMLPAIYDARARLFTENDANGLNDTTDVTFARLDMDLKGTKGKNEQEWVTENCTYGLNPLLTRVSASLNRGKYAGTALYYNGNSISCCGDTGVCDALNLSSDYSCRQLFAVTPFKATVTAKWSQAGQAAITAPIYRKALP